jgi:glutaminyl-tRNA synthetase
MSGSNTRNGNKNETTEVSVPPNFIRHIIEDDIQTGKYDGRVITRFPPEPNGYLHIGHAKSICLNFGFSIDYNGSCHLRFDDTNPGKENVEFVDAIKEDVRWMGFEWNEHLHFTSDYFDRLFDYAVALIKIGKAYVDSQNAEEIRENRGTLKNPGIDSPYRNRSVEENLELFHKMKDGEFEEGACILRGKIDMRLPNIVMRDPALYRIRKLHHHRTNDQWCIYPMYDFAHCLSDSIEKITHSLCTLEFENNRELYDWILDALNVYHCQQIEFARLNLSYTVLSKRKLIELVDGNYVSGWDDPRMPTISGLRRRGYTPAAIRNFCERIGVAKRDSMVDFALLEHCIREDLNKKAPRVMAVLNPLRVVIENYPDDQSEEMDAVNNPEDKTMGTRKVPFSKVLYIEQDDFMEDPPKKFFRLGPGREVRLRYAYFVTCTDVIKDENGKVVELRCTYDPATRGGDAPDGRKVKATLHWVSERHALNAEVRLYENLFNVEKPASAGDFKTTLNENSVQVRKNCKVEPSLGSSEPGFRCQFERLGYFNVDVKDSTPGNLVFNRIVTLRDMWAKIKKQQQSKKK